MGEMFKFGITAVFTAIIIHSAAQNALPDFSVDSLGKNRIRVSWINPYGSGLVQVSVQSSYDSVKDFRTFFSATSPQLPQNGVLDNRPGGKLYYRIFYAFSGGSYAFTKSKRPGTGPVVQTDEPNANVITQPPPVDVNAPSVYVMINADGFPEVKLPNAATKKYKLIFFDENHNRLFSLNKITDPDLVLDKTNFLHAGNFYFELYDGDKLVEKNHIYLQKDF
ncbi:MAG TPA: hypothetical protein VG738_08390 [Chitinophagaceae bacterium]|nr:hypothetical protein [Chitinophagaceae bacterium]